MNRLKTIAGSVVISLFFLGHALDAAAADEDVKEEKIGETEAKETAAKETKKDGLMERIDFGNSYILGQSIKSGAVYLLHRKKSDIKSMLETREDYRKEILEDFKVSEEP